jgi:hypothetical protein
MGASPGEPLRPQRQLQLPGCKCIISGKCLGQLSCTCYAFAMGIDRATQGKKRPTGCHLRDLTNDTIGGTNQSQLAAVTRQYYGVATEVRNGSSVASTNYAAGQLYRGRGFVLAGNAGALLTSPVRSTRGFVNHAVWVNEGRGWERNEAGIWIPDACLVYDPAANGTYGGNAPDWWSWALVKRFAAYLRPWGDSDTRILGSGKMYATFFPDTEPHVHLRFTGSRKPSPFPKAFKVDPPGSATYQNIRTGPSTKYSVTKRVPKGTSFVAYQVNTAGQLIGGSRIWYGDHDGNRWIHKSGLVLA